MGRGNVCTHNEYEGLYYLARDLLDVYRKVERCGCGHVTGFDFDEEPKTARELSTAGIQYDFDGALTGWGYDLVESEMNWNDMIAFMREKLSKRFSSFSSVDKWQKRGDGRIILENAFFQIVVIDNEWSAAWCLLERNDVDDTGRNRTLMRRHHQTYLEAIKNTLIEGWGEAIGYGGAWTSGEKYTKEDAA